MENSKFKNFGGGATLLDRNSKGLGGIFWGKLLRYYDTKALRSNSRISKSDLQYVILNLFQDLKNNVKPLSPLGRGCHEVTEEGLSGKNVSEAQSKELNVITSYRLNDFKKKIAFTLAEVLITLGIIGIVAAMTIPTLVAKYQEKVMVTKVKQAHSQLMNAIQLYVAKNNCQNMLCLFDTNKTSDEVIAELATVVRKAKVCKEGDTEKACKYYGLKDNKPSYKVDGVYASSDGITTNGRMYLPNGMIFQVRQGSQCPRTLETIIRDENGYEIDRVETVSHTCAFVYFDVNNTQGPNQFGADVYRYSVQDTGKIVPSKLLNNALLYNKIEYTPYNIGDPVE